MFIKYEFKKKMWQKIGREKTSKIKVSQRRYKTILLSAKEGLEEERSWLKIKYL